MLLRNLIKKYPINIKRNIEIKNLASDSRKVKKGDLFFALKGTKLDGNHFIKKAINKGAKAVICSSNFKLKSKNIIIINKFTNDPSITRYRIQLDFIIEKT